MGNGGSSLQSAVAITRRELQQQQQEGVSGGAECDTVHIAFVVAGTKAVRDFTAVMKSLLFHRHSPLHFHFISDDVAQSILRVLLETWDLPLLNYTFYSTNTIEPSVSWIPNAHYSGIFGLMKLTLPSLLAINKVIVMDIDVTVVSDVYDLWKLFSEIIDRGRLIGLVENQSDWYLGTIWKDHNPWPAVGKGFNTGVMLMNLEAMRKSDWSKMWQTIATITLSVHEYTALADQDIINTVIKWHPDIVHELSCTWNVQLSDHSKSAGCYMNRTSYNIVHWNSPRKLKTTAENAPFFRELHYTFVQYDGAHLKHSLIYCLPSPPSSSRDNNPRQSSYTNCHGKHKPFRTHFYFYGEATFRNSSVSYDVGLVSQLSMDRLSMIERILKHWAGPVSLALYASDSETKEFTDYMDGLELANRENLVVHVVYKEYKRFYPVNYLRNVALNASNTPFVFLTDIDFVPMFRLYSYLREASRILKLDTRKRVLIVPAFESLQYRFDYPIDKQTLVKSIEEGGIATFRHKIWEKGHSATNYNKWYDASSPFKINWAPDYEPYVVVSRDIPRFDERFVGFGWNKVSHAIQLDAAGYDFVVLPDAFTIHFPHFPSADVMHYRTNKKYRDCQKELKTKFVNELIQKYGAKAKKYLNN